MDELKTPTSPQEVQETLQDGTKIQVTFDTPDIETPPEWVKVRKCPRGDFVEFAGALLGHDEIAEAAFYIEKTPAYVNSLSDESFEAVMQEGRRLNFTRFRSWFERKQQLLQVSKVTSREIQAVAEKLAERMGRGTLPSSTSS